MLLRTVFLDKKNYVFLEPIKYFGIQGKYIFGKIQSLWNWILSLFKKTGLYIAVKCFFIFFIFKLKN